MLSFPRGGEALIHGSPNSQDLNAGTKHEQLKPKDLIGKREARERILSDVELRAVWKAAGKIGYPDGLMFRLLVLSGQREREAADLRRPEIDFGERSWTIPAERMKGGRAHEVPTRRRPSPYSNPCPVEPRRSPFHYDRGEKPVNGFSKAKARIDKLSGITGRVINDLWRTMRTHASALPVEDLVRELVIAHGKPGLHQVYDQHRYRDEKRSCLELWQAGLLSIVEACPADVADLAEARERCRAEA